MLKIAYRIGVQKALQNEDIDRLVKEAAELGIDLEKLGFGLGSLVTGAKALGGGLSAAGRGAMGAGKAVAKGFSRGRAGGQGMMSSLGRGLKGAGGQMTGAWKGMSPLQQKMLMGAAGTAAIGAGGALAANNDTARRGIGAGMGLAGGFR